MSKTEPKPNERHPFIQYLTRRGFMGRVIGGIAALIGAALFVPLAGYTIFPSLKRKAREWESILSLDQIQPETPKSVELIKTLKDGWQTSTNVKSVWVVHKKDGEVVTYAPLCTHLGCGYRWEAERKAFFCPCHSSVFDINGKVISGPAPRPLDTLPTKIEGDQIWTIYKEFKAGTSKKIEL